MIVGTRGSKLALETCTCTDRLHQKLFIQYHWRRSRKEYHKDQRRQDNKLPVI